MAALQQHVATIKSAYYAKDSRSLLAAFRIDPTTFFALQNDLNKTVSVVYVYGYLSMLLILNLNLLTCLFLCSHGATSQIGCLAKSQCPLHRRTRIDFKRSSPTCSPTCATTLLFSMLRLALNLHIRPTGTVRTIRGHSSTRVLPPFFRCQIPHGSSQAFVSSLRAL